MTSLLDNVRQLADDAIAAAAGTELESTLRGVRNRIETPLQVAIAGKVKAGKSTLLNALVGEELAPTDLSECTKVVTWYRRSDATQVTAVPDEGDPFPVAFGRNPTLDVNLEGRAPESLRWLVVDWPSERLRSMTFVDTPGIASLSPQLTQRTTRFLDPSSGGAAKVDAVIYLMRHLHTDDARLLETFHGTALAQPSPVNCLGVLSRADEIGVMRLDAMESAERIAERYLGQSSIRRLCQTVVPFAGLLAQAAVSLRESEYAAFRALIDAGVDQDSALLASVQGFLDDVAELPVTTETRTELLDRYGLFGIRTAIRVLRTEEIGTAGALAAALEHESGLTRLRSQLQTEIGSRANVLKARSALAEMGRLITLYPERLGQLADDLERVEASAHELEELRLLTALRLAAVPLPDADLAQAVVLLENASAPAAVRLGLPPDAAHSEVDARLHAMVASWQQRAEHPLTRAAGVHACRIVIRTLEGLAAQRA